MDDVVDNLLSIWRDIAAFFVVATIQIDLAYIERVLAQIARDFIDDVFDGNRALWTAEASEGCVRLRVGLAAQSEDIDVR